MQREVLRDFDLIFSPGWLDDPAKFEMIMEGPDKTKRLERQERMKLEVDVLTKALEDLEPLLGKFSTMEGQI